MVRHYVPRYEPDEKVRKVLALDLATKTGWAWWSRFEEKAQSGVIDFGPGDGAFERLAEYLTSTEAFRGRPDLIVYEMPHHRGGAATFKLVGLAARLRSWSHERQIRCEPIHSATIKKFVTGSGKASKDEVAKAARSAFPHITPADDNETDALAILLTGIEKFTA